MSKRCTLGWHILVSHTIHEKPTIGWGILFLYQYNSANHHCIPLGWLIFLHDFIHFHLSSAQLWFLSPSLSLRCIFSVACEAFPIDCHIFLFNSIYLPFFSVSSDFPLLVPIHYYLHSGWEDSFSPPSWVGMVGACSLTHNRLTGERQDLCICVCSVMRDSLIDRDRGSYVM